MVFVWETNFDKLLNEIDDPGPVSAAARGSLHQRPLACEEKRRRPLRWRNQNNLSSEIPHVSRDSEVVISPYLAESDQVSDAQLSLTSNKVILKDSLPESHLFDNLQKDENDSNSATTVERRYDVEAKRLFQSEPSLIPPNVATTLEHILSQLDILTQVI
ncbi:unnamed protein product [Protopolystoma xenopodis]|uniref:Uncharacterized protein n=1 Tax=Protopolystoma xenopodis TaxID=117903 RepID=A0A3S5BV99_9PLAT|nr:unnamed protein product [Protopolystoma xenopodis]